MSAYYCFRCDRMRDEDYNCCEVDPEDNTQFICESCFEKIEEEKEE